jgi:hypothetical protein
MGYLEAYRARLERNNDELLALANKVLQLDKTNTIRVYVHESKPFKQNLVFIRGEEINSISFHEVPYHWSGCGHEDHAGGDNVSMPFTVRDVMTTFKPITLVNKSINEKFKTVDQFLKWYSFYKEYKPAK